MGRKAYLQEYQVKEQIVNGKVKRHVVYTGEYFRFKAETPQRKPLAIKVLLLQVLAIALFMVPLCTVNRLSNVAYVLLPHILLIVPFWLIIAAARRAAFGRESMEHELADKTTNGYTWGVWSGVILSAIDVVGCLIWLIFFSAGTATVNDWVFLVCAAAVLGCMVFALRNRELCRVKVAEKEFN